MQLSATEAVPPVQVNQVRAQQENNPQLLAMKEQIDEMHIDYEDMLKAREETRK